jgi:penicillin-binding protein 1A
MKRILLAVVVAAVLCGVAFVALWGAVRTQDCPSVDALRDYRPPEATRVFAMDGSLVADLSPERRVVVDLDAIPPTVSNGFVAVEDRRFWQHGGIDVRGIGRAVWRNITTLSLVEGFSTITMQLPRNIFPTELPRSDKLRRKLCEVQLAGRIERTMNKRDILKLYINQVYLGDGKYGIEEASRAYFGKNARRLTTAEAALLVGLVKNPEGYNPRRHPARAIQRRNVVLDVMAREQVITRAEAEKAKAEALTLAPPPEAAGAAPWYVAAVRRELRERYGDDADIRGLRVFTGLDPAVQRAARDELTAQIRRVEAGEYGRWPHGKPPGDASDGIAPAQGSGSPYLQGMVLVLDVRTGEVRAVVGGRDFTHSSYDRAFSMRRQPGSAFKPIVYAAALQQGLTPASRIDTSPVEIGAGGAGGGTGTWRPEDHVPDSVTSLSVRQALALSSNSAAVRVGEWAGIGRVIETARALGITTPLPAVPSIVLGSAEIVPAEFAAAFAALGNGGTRVTPTLITRIEDTRGTVLWQAPYIATGATQPIGSPRQAGAVGAQAIDAGVAFLTTSLMQDVIDRGTGTAVRNNGFWLPAAGKTGTTNDAKDVWFAGITPDLAAVVWLGFDQPTQIMPNAFGGNLAAPIWAKVMTAAYEKRPRPHPWPQPANVVSVPIDTETGALATDDCPPDHVTIEHYLAGTEPLEYCPLHGGEGRGRGLFDRIRGLFGGG